MATKKQEDSQAQQASEQTTTPPSDEMNNVMYPEVTTVTDEQAEQARRERDEELLADSYVQGRTEPPATEYKDVNTPGRGPDPNLHAADQPHPVHGLGSEREQAGDNRQGDGQTREAKARDNA